MKNNRLKINGFFDCSCPEHISLSKEYLERTAVRIGIPDVAKAIAADYKERGIENEEDALSTCEFYEELKNSTIEMARFLAFALRDERFSTETLHRHFEEIDLYYYKDGDTSGYDYIAYVDVDLLPLYKEYVEVEKKNRREAEMTKDIYSFVNMLQEKYGKIDEASYLEGLISTFANNECIAHKIFSEGDIASYIQENFMLPEDAIFGDVIKKASEMIGLYGKKSLEECDDGDWGIIRNAVIRAIEEVTGGGKDICIAKDAFNLFDMLNGHISGGIVAPRILLSATKKDDGSVAISWRHPETCGLSDVRYHYTDTSAHTDIYSYDENGYLLLNGSSDPFHILDEADFSELRPLIQAFLDKWKLKYPEKKVDAR